LAESTATPEAPRNLPVPLPEPPQVNKKVPVEENFDTRSVKASETYMLPRESTAIPDGVTNPPGTSPGIPAFSRKFPLESNFWNRLPFPSET
jgi:hypothetical protein